MDQYWQNYNVIQLLQDPKQEQRRQTNATRIADRERNFRRDYDAFVEGRLFTNLPDARFTDEIKRLSRWITHESYSYCSACGVIQKQKLLPSYGNRRSEYVHDESKCLCTEYIVPRIEHFPDCLKVLSIDDQKVLQILKIDTGKYSVHKHGYRQKTAAISLYVKEDTVRQRIDNIENADRKRRLKVAYNWLVSNSDISHYRAKLEEFESMPAGTKIPFYKAFRNDNIETALWPVMYFHKDYNESTVLVNERTSTKKGYICKVLSTITDYMYNFELLQFNYDRHIYKTVSGAIETARKLNCSPARALEDKLFTEMYWKWQHRYLIDAVTQFGFPDLFITISPYEWSFPHCQWLQEFMNVQSQLPINSDIGQTLILAHVLDQLVRGYLTGTNESSKWKQYLFKDKRHPAKPNVKMWFNRFEFARRESLHCHMLIWLNKTTDLQLERLSAKIPDTTPEFAYMVYKRQASHKVASDSILSEQTRMENNRIILQRDAESVAAKLRGYIDTLSAVLKCSMDVQCGDGRAMLLEYVTSYVTKWKDGINDNSMYGHDITGQQAAFRFVVEGHPGAPQMAMSMNSFKFSNTNAHTKKIVLPKFGDAPTSCVEKYMARPQSANDLNIVQYYRTYVIDANPHLYKQKATVCVGVQYNSMLSANFFWQYVVAHVPFRQLNELLHPDNDAMPKQLQPFAAAMHNIPEFWNDDIEIRKMLQQHGHKDHYIKTVMAYITSQRDIVRLWQRRLITNEQMLNMANTTLNREFNFTQSVFVNQVSDILHTMVDNPETAEFTPVLLTGGPGTGKSFCLEHVIEQCCEMSISVRVACATGLLASTYKAKYPNVKCDTVHSTYKIGVQDGDKPKINWELCLIKAFIIDEISLLNKDIMQHIFLTHRALPQATLLILCGDQHQTQPIEGENLFRDDDILRDITRRHHFVQSVRCQCEKLQSFLDVVRVTSPTVAQLNYFCKSHLSMDEEPTVQDIHYLSSVHKNTLFLCVSRSKVNFINQTIVEELFKMEKPLLTIPCLQVDEVTKHLIIEDAPIYKGERLVILENRNNDFGYVNGVVGVVKTVQGGSIILETPTRETVVIYPVTTTLGTYYPVAPYYASTIYKVQGQTLDHVTIWFDSFCGEGLAYVAISRVRTIENLLFLVHPKPAYFCPVESL